MVAKSLAGRLIPTLFNQKQEIEINEIAKKYSSAKLNWITDKFWRFECEKIRKGGFEEVSNVMTFRSDDATSGNNDGS